MTTKRKLNPTEPLPADIVCEFLGSVSFSRNQERDVDIAEQIASNIYTDMDDLVSTVKGMIDESPRRKKDFAKTVAEARKSPFYAPFFKVPK